MQMVLIAGITVITVALPAVQRDLGLTRSDLALVTAAYGLSFGGLLMLGGRLADVAGRRRVFRIGVAVFGIGSVAAAVSPGLVTLVAARFVQGAGAALVAPAALALLGAVYSDRERLARKSALWGGLSGIGATAGTLLGGVVVTFASWRWTFAVPAAVALAVATLAPRLLPAPPPLRSTVDVRSALLITLGVSLVSFGFLRMGERSTTEVFGSIVAGAAALAWFFLRQRGASNPMFPLALLAAPRRATGVVTIFVMAGGMATSVFLLSLYFQQELGYSPLSTSAAFLPYCVVQVAVGMAAGRLVGRFGARQVTVLGLTLVAVGLGLFAIGGAPPVHAGLIAFAAGSALAFSGAMVAAVDGVPDHQAGLVGGVVNTAMETGPTVGFAVLISLGGSAFVVASAAFVLTAAFAALDRKERNT